MLNRFGLKRYTDACRIKCGTKGYNQRESRLVSNKSRMVERIMLVDRGGAYQRLNKRRFQIHFGMCW